MRKLSTNELFYISAAHGSDDLSPLIGNPLSSPDMLAAPTDWHTPGIAGGLLVLSTIFNTAATATTKPNIPLWGAPVTLSLGLGLFGIAFAIGQCIDWLDIHNS